MPSVPRLANLPDLLTVRQVSKVLQVTEPYVYELTAKHHLPVVRIGRGCIRIPRVHLAKLAGIANEKEVEESGTQGED